MNQDINTIKWRPYCCGSYNVRAMPEAIGKPTELPDRPGVYQLYALLLQQRSNAEDGSRGNK